MITMVAALKEDLQNHKQLCRKKYLHYENCDDFVSTDEDND